jgi:Mechanosensitive ion channel, conserved TM helix
MEQQMWSSFSEVLTNLKNYLPSLLAGMVVLLLGGICAWIGARLLVRLLLFSRVDRVIVRLGWSRALEKADVRQSLFSFAGLAFGAVVFLVFLENAIVIWRLTVLSSLLQRFLELIPKLLAAGLALLVGWGTAVAAARFVRRTLEQEDFARARLAGRAVYAGVLMTTLAIVLVQLEVAPAVIIGAFLITFGGLALTVVLAFGLGSRRAVERMWEQRLGGPGVDQSRDRTKPD